MKNTPNTFTASLIAAALLFSAWPAPADQFSGNGDTGFGGAIGNGTLTLTDDGTNISGTFPVGGSMNDVLVLYIQSGPSGFTNTSGFNDQQDACRQAISGVSASGRSLLTFAGGFQPNYAIALAPTAAGTGGLWQLANGGNNSLVYLGSVNLTPLNNSGPYTFSFPAALIGMIPDVRSTIQVFGTDISGAGYRSTEAIAGNLTGAQGWNPFTQTAYASYTFDAGAVLVRLPSGIWTQRPGSAPAERGWHTAVWTGSEMIVWGGADYYRTYEELGTGGRYNPVADTWMALPTSGAPTPRMYHTAVWTGTEMIVWGGSDFGDCLNDGGRYDPVANSWSAVLTQGAPTARKWHTAIWTGSEMVIWGGVTNSGPLNDGGRYNPEVNSWMALPSDGAPAARYEHTALWTGSDMVVWGGASNATNCFAGGARYSPAVNSWTALSTNGAPLARAQHSAVWTGSEMIVWGGCSNTLYYANGGRYNPTANSWTAVPNLPYTPNFRRNHTAVWTGNEMIVWGGFSGGYLNNGGRYNPVANSWTALPTTGAPSARAYHTAIWTGTGMIVWGGFYAHSGTFTCFNDGRRYDPLANTWATVPVNPVPAARQYHTAVWTGTEMIVWGGSGSSGYLNDGGRFNPAANAWTMLPTAGAPSARELHTAVWTGSEMIVWGGAGGYGYLNDGGRYNPLLNSWTLLPTTGAPTARWRHTAVWTGTEMIVWGGDYQYNGGLYGLNDGGRYNPTANAWAGLTTSGAPVWRELHTAVWTGSNMVIWGGHSVNGDWYFLDDGGRYNPATDSWTALPTTGAPAARDEHTAVWTGAEMIVWGGANDSGLLNDGGRYNPTANSWTAVPTNGAPAGRYWHTAVWTGSEMIVWGGEANVSPIFMDDGGRYNPAANSWTAVPSTAAPDGRYGHTAVWTATEMIIFGGGMPDPWSYYPYAPTVRISPSGPTSAEVAWPVWSSTLRLCQTTNLATGPWTTVTNTITQVGSENRVTLSPLTGSQFFRAEYP